MAQNKIEQQKYIYIHRSLEYHLTKPIKSDTKPVKREKEVQVDIKKKDILKFVQVATSNWTNQIQIVIKNQHDQLKYTHQN